jgi:hypothetical protein
VGFLKTRGTMGKYVSYKCHYIVLHHISISGVVVEAWIRVKRLTNVTPFPLTTFCHPKIEVKIELKVVRWSKSNNNY